MVFYWHANGTKVRAAIVLPFSVFFSTKSLRGDSVIVMQVTSVKFIASPPARFPMIDLCSSDCSAELFSRRAKKRINALE